MMRPNRSGFEAKSPMGAVEMVDTPDGERVRMTVNDQAPGLSATIVIDRSNGVVETLPLAAVSDDNHRFQSSVAPAEPHEFSGELHLSAGGRTDVLPFTMTEPAHHPH